MFKAGEISLESGFMSAALPADAPFDEEYEWVDINCYQNCVMEESQINEHCNPEWLLNYDQIEYVPPGMVQKSKKSIYKYIEFIYRVNIYSRLGCGKNNYILFLAF